MSIAVCRSHSDVHDLACDGGDHHTGSLGGVVLTNLLGYEGDLCAGLLVGLDYVCKVYVECVVRIHENYVVLLELVDVLLHALECFEVRGEKLSGGSNVCGLERRYHSDTAFSSREVPVLTATDMLNERTVAVICYDVDVRDVCVYHVGEAEVNESVSASKRYSRNGSVCGQSRQGVVIKT